MQTPQHIPLTPEQLAAVRQGDGYVQLVDPNTQQIYFLTEPIKPTIDDSYVREKLDEAQSSVDRGDVSEWDVEKMKTELHERVQQADKK